VAARVTAAHAAFGAGVGTHEVVRQSSTRAVLRWLRGRPDLSECSAGATRPDSAAARVLGRIAIRHVLIDAGMPDAELPALSEIGITPDGFGRPVVSLPARTAEWMRARRLGLDLSLAHAGHRLLAVALAAP
jgi:hypothetical protein